MNQDEFWGLVTRSDATQSQESIVAELKAKLSSLSDDQLMAFDKWYGQQMRRSYTWDVWGAAYIVGGCDSEYAFAEFRNFLLSLGADWYDKIVSSPDLLADLPQWPEKDGSAYPFIDDYDLIAGQIFEDRTERELPFVPSGKSTPAGKKFNQKPKMLKKTYPKLSSRFPF